MKRGRKQNPKVTKENLKSFVNIVESGCWEWKGTITSAGYGYVDGKPAHRVIWQLFNGEFPDLPGHHGAVVRHTCDNRKCVNPGHLLIGTHRDNIKDMLDRGRSDTIKGKTALTNEEVIEVRRLREEGWTYQKLADKFEKAVGTIHEIINGRNKAEHKDGDRRPYRSLMDRKVPDIVPVAKKKKGSQFKGVYYNKSSGAWTASHKGKYLGSFDLEIEAAEAYAESVRKYQEEFNSLKTDPFGPDREPVDSDWLKS